MPTSFKHLRIEREPLENNRRTRNFIPQYIRQSDLHSHGQYLNNNLQTFIQTANQQPKSAAENYFLKINYSGTFDFSHLHKHGIEFISQVNSEVCIAFANEQQLNIFAEHLNRLGLNDATLTYKQILESIQGISGWTEEDRKSIAIINAELPTDENFQLDIELWPIYLANHPLRVKLCTAFEEWMLANGVRKIDKVNLDSLLMYRIETSPASSMLLFNHNDIRHIDFTPTSGITHQSLSRDINTIPSQISSPPQDAARICILDSGINTSHPLLASAIAESAGFLEDTDDVFDNHGHGTAVAGITLYGDVEACDTSNFWQPQILLFNGKVLDDNAEFDQKSILNTLIESITYFAQEHQCKIFNLSFGNANAPYDQMHIGGIAYVLDKLARDLNVLFVVSTGNFVGSENPNLPLNSWRDEYPEYLGAPQSAIIDPAPALNVLTVGSLARHNATFDAQRYPEIHQLSPASEMQPSPFTRHGPSIKGAIKPDLVAFGGNLANPMRQSGQQWKPDMRGLGVLTFNHKFIGNTLYSEMSGTSFAAPYISHLAGKLLNNYPSASANLLRALLVNHANMQSEIEQTFSDGIKAAYKGSYARDIERDVAGYGLVDEEELFRSSENVVVLMVEENIDNNVHHFFELPLPNDFLRSQRSAREIRVSLSYFPAVRTTRLDYVATKIHFKLVKGRSLEAVQRHFNHATQNNTATKKEASATNREISSLLREKGTVQSSKWLLKQLRPSEKWFVVVTRQDREWAKDLSIEHESYALVVTVTDREKEDAQLYTQISQRIEQQQQARVRIRG